MLQQEVREVIVSTQRILGGHEFSILFKGGWHANGFWQVYNEYMIPEQLTERASVEFQQNVAMLRQNEGFNTVAHSHPFSSDSYFSQPDEDTINSHFPCSLLSNNRGRVIRGNLLVNISIGITTDENGGQLMATEKLSISIEGDNIETFVPSVEVAGVDNIKKKPIPIRSGIGERGTNGNGDLQTTNKGNGIRECTRRRLQAQS